MGMEERYELGEVKQLAAVAMGVPGKRTFFLILGRPGEWVRAWLEKELLEALALAIEQLLASLGHEGLYSPPREEPEAAPDAVPAGLPAAEVEIEQIALGYEREMATVVLTVQPLGPQTLDWTELSCRASLDQLKKLGVQAGKICVAGRPRCALCGLPIEPEGHICPKTN